jgi:hypothetical protein
MRFFKPFLFAFTACLASPAFAGTFYCGTHIIDLDMPSGEVIKYCGEPTERNEDLWTYDRGEEEFPVVLHIEPDGTVGRIEEQTE